MDSNGHPSSIEVFTHTKKKKNTTINIKVGELEDEYIYIYIYIYIKAKKNRQVVERNQRGYLKENPISKSEELSYFQKEKIS
jgi:hypothetical protein